MCVIASISEEKGVDYFEIHDAAIDRDRFHSYLRSLRELHGKKSLCCFMDNLSVHRMKETKDLCEELDIFPVYNESYSPDTNPIENCFSLVKRHYQKEKLNTLAQQIPFNMQKQIEKSMQSVSREYVINCIRHSLNLL